MTLTPLFQGIPKGYSAVLIGMKTLWCLECLRGFRVSCMAVLLETLAMKSLERLRPGPNLPPGLR